MLSFDGVCGVHFRNVTRLDRVGGDIHVFRVQVLKRLLQRSASIPDPWQCLKHASVAGRLMYPLNSLKTRCGRRQD